MDIRQTACTLARCRHHLRIVTEITGASLDALGHRDPADFYDCYHYSDYS